MKWFGYLKFSGKRSFIAAIQYKITFNRNKSKFYRIIFHSTKRSLLGIYSKDYSIQIITWPYLINIVLCNMKYLFLFIAYISINLLGTVTGHMPNQAMAQAPVSFKAKMDSLEHKNILDVRMPREYSVGHIKGAKNYNVYDKSFKEKVSALDKKSPVFVYCKGGGRSALAVKQLEELGFTDIHELKGGILAWEAQSLPVVKEKTDQP